MGMSTSIPIVSAVIGAVVLLFGRKLFWLCVAAVGFAAGFEIAPQLIHEPSTLVMLIFAIGLGFIGALLALFLQKIAIAIAGFLAGGKLAVAIAAAFLVHPAQYFWLSFLIGGVVGALLLIVLFDWALIALSSVVGAYLILSAFSLPASGTSILFIALVAIGVFVQITSMRRSGTLAD
jgi:Domain of unknown function (DUF4203)